MLSKEKKEALRAEIVIEGGEHDSAGKCRYITIAGASDMDQRADSLEFQEHSAEMTPMLVSQVNAGHINCLEHYEIANMESLCRAAKPNTPAFFEGVIHFAENVDAVQSFSDEVIDTYRNVRGEPMPGLRWSEAEQKLVRVKDATVDEKRLYLAQSLVPAAGRQSSMMLNSSKFAPEQLEEMKPSTIKALAKLQEKFGQPKTEVV